MASISEAFQPVISTVILSNHTARISTGTAAIYASTILV